VEMKNEKPNVFIVPSQLVGEVGQANFPIFFPYFFIVVSPLFLMTYNTPSRIRTCDRRIRKSSNLPG